MKRPPIGVLAVFLAVVCAACIPFAGGKKLNTEQKEDLVRAASLEPI